MKNIDEETLKRIKIDLENACFIFNRFIQMGFVNEVYSVAFDRMLNTVDKVDKIMKENHETTPD